MDISVSFSVCKAVYTAYRASHHFMMKSNCIELWYIDILWFFNVWQSYYCLMVEHNACQRKKCSFIPYKPMFLYCYIMIQQRQYINVSIHTVLLQICLCMIVCSHDQGTDMKDHLCTQCNMTHSVSCYHFIWLLMQLWST